MELTLDQALQKAVEAHKVGKIQDAERLYRAILRVQPQHPDTNHNLGVLAVGVGKPEEALPYLKTALEANPSQGQFWVSYINGLIQTNRYEEARKTLQEGKKVGLAGEPVEQLEQRLNEESQQKNLSQNSKKSQKVKPGNAKAGKTKLSQRTSSSIQAPSQQAINELLSSYNAGNLGLAERQAKSLTEAYPYHPFGWKVVGAIYKMTGRLEESLEPMNQSVRLSPHDAEAHYNLGNALKDLGRLAEAETSYREAIRLKPDFAEAHSNLGSALKVLGRLAEAETSYREAIRLKPDFAEAHSNLGNALKDLGRLAEAEASYREAIRFKPNYAEAHSNLGVTLKDLGRIAEAEASYREAIRLKPDYAEAHSNLGVTLKDLGRLAEAEASYREAIRLKPEYAEAHSNLGNALQDLGRLAEAEGSYREAIRLKPDFPEAHSNLLFSLNYVESLTPEAALVEAQRYGAMVSSKAEPKFASWLAHPEATKLRIGFVSGDLKNHPVGYFVEGLIKHLDQSRFELYAFPTAPIQDDLTDRIKPLFNQWIPIFGKNDLSAASLIHDQGIHILLDLSGHTAHNRLPVFAYKPAPVQVSWLGYFATTGLSEMDYLLGAPFVTPLCEAHHFSETLWQMPETYLCFTPPNEDISVGTLPALANGHITLGCFNNLTKMGAPVVELWSRVLHSIPNAKLFLKTRQLAEPGIVNNVIGQFASYNIPAERLILEGPSTRAELLAAYSQVDIALDPFPYPGGTTSAEALWMGVPVLTLKGDRFLSHVGETVAHNAGQSDWIAQDPDDYVRNAVTFSNDLDQLSELRQSLRSKVLQSPLFDAERFARNFEIAIKQMWESQQT